MANTSGFKRKKIRMEHSKSVQMNKEMKETGDFIEDRVKKLLEKAEREGIIETVPSVNAHIKQ